MADTTIAVVDDSPAVVQALRTALEGAGFRVITAGDGDRAIPMILQEKPDLILSDVQMPNLDGFFLCQIVRSRPETKHIPFIFLTSLDAPSKRSHGFKLGADDFIPKPFDRDEVVLRVQNILRRTAPGKASAAAPEASGLAGQIREFPLPDILQMLHLHRKSATLHLDAAGAAGQAPAKGQVIVRDGQVLGATAGQLQGIKAFFRLFAWKEASFRIEYGDNIPSGGVILGEIDKLTMTAIVHLDESSALLEHMGGLDGTWKVDLGHEVEATAVDQRGKYVLLMVHRYRRLGDILDHSQLADGETLKRLAHLVRLGVVQPATAAAG